MSKHNSKPKKIAVCKNCNRATQHVLHRRVRQMSAIMVCSICGNRKEQK